MDKSLIVKNLNKSFNNLNVFHGISFEVKPGTIVNLSGPNGSGKTTLMRIISSQILDYEGEVAIGDKNIIDFDKEIFSIIYYVAPYSSLYEHLTLSENINFFIALNNLKDKNQKNLLIKRFKLESHLSRKIHELSDGTRKKVSILILFLINPDFCILDEPYTYLDEESSLVLNELIYDYQKQGKSFLITDNSLASKNLNFNGVVEL
ncbi:ABC transporter ATP-binding protein [bacterium]|nr:ABC transporter ATP-binding protein [bacterium]|tara:strand:+ start:25350 stop:25967 length:618 start_codon:yes stop_codon:yes gene_type:complete